MGESFKGWRRKVGIVTLGLALAVTALQHRSQDRFDGVYLGGKPTQFNVLSIHGRIRLIKRTSQGSQPQFIHWVIGAKLEDSYRDPLARASVEWRRDCLGVIFGVLNVRQLMGSPMRIELLEIPQWFFILPLTLLSAYLLLVKPRPKKPPVSN